MTKELENIPYPTEKTGDDLRSPKRSNRLSTNIIQQIDRQEKPGLNSKEAITSFLRTLYGDRPQGYLTLWSLADKKTHWFKANEFASFADRAIKLASRTDVYFGVGLRGERLDENHRGTTKDVIAIPGFWADIDVNGSAHKGLDYPPTKEAALKLVTDFPLHPTVGGCSARKEVFPAVLDERPVYLLGSASACQAMLQIAAGKIPFYGRES